MHDASGVTAMTAIILKVTRGRGGQDGNRNHIVIFVYSLSVSLFYITIYGSILKYVCSELTKMYRDSRLSSVSTLCLRQIIGSI